MHSSGPSDLVVDVGDSKGDYVDLKLQWEAGMCPGARYQVFVQTPSTAKRSVGNTTKANFVIENQEFWTRYTVTLETSYCFVSNALVTKIETGPGSEFGGKRAIYD